MKNYLKHWSIIRNAVLLIGCAFSGMGSSCLGTGPAESFKPTITPSALSVKTKSWSSAAILNENLNSPSDGTTYGDANVTYSTTYPEMSVFSDIAQNFYVVFSQKNTTDADAYMIGTNLVRLETNLWGDSADYFTRLDGPPNSTNYDSERPKTVVDTSGNSWTLFLSQNSTTNRRPLIIKKDSGLAQWHTAVDLSDTDVSEAAANRGVLPNSFAIASDISSRVMTVWCEQFGAGATDYTLYYNYYSGTTWKFLVDDNSTSTQLVESGLLCNDSGVSTTGVGVDFDFVNSSNYGMLAYASEGSAIKVKRFDGHTKNWSATTAETISGASTDQYPRIFVDSGESAYVFFYRNVVTNTGDLYLAKGTYSGTFDTPTQFDSSVGTGSVYNAYDGTDPDVMPPVLAHHDDYAAVGFIKSDGTSRRAYVSIYDSTDGSWSTPEPVDSGGAGYDVTWLNLAVSSEGEVIAVYSQIGSDSTEHVYANIYKQEAWRSRSQLDNISTLSGSAAPGFSRPTVAYDTQGNAVATFSMNESGTRKAVAVVYK